MFLIGLLCLVSFAAALPEYLSPPVRNIIDDSYANEDNVLNSEDNNSDVIVSTIPPVPLDYSKNIEIQNDYRPDESDKSPDTEEPKNNGDNPVEPEQEKNIEIQNDYRPDESDKSPDTEEPKNNEDNPEEPEQEKKDEPNEKFDELSTPVEFEDIVILHLDLPIGPRFPIPLPPLPEMNIPIPLPLMFNRPYRRYPYNRYSKRSYRYSDYPYVVNGGYEEPETWYPWY